MSGEKILEIRNMHKTFGPSVALKNVSIRLNRGEIYGLIGENGSGKSTIMSIASGMQPCTSGEMFYKDQKWEPVSMIEAQRNGISMILQEANTIPNVTVAQNIYAGREAEFSKFGILNFKKMEEFANKRLAHFGITHIKASDIINRYNFEDRKLVEIVRCVDNNTEILVVDETTTALSHDGRKILYDLIHRMAEQENKTVVFISHDMDEILEHCSVLIVLRDGEIVGTLSQKEMKAENAVQRIRYLMVGREIGEKYYREDFVASCKEEVALQLEHIYTETIKDFNLTLHKGEIIGLGGLSGCGMHEIGRIAYGIEKPDTGKVLRNGKQIKTPLSAIESGIGYISKNRDLEALILGAAIRDNIALPSLPRLAKHLFIRPNAEKKLADHEIEAFHIKCQNGKQPVGTLSGGNKQKVSFAKWTANDSEVIIMDCPTRGVDIGVKQFMYSLIEQMKKNGKAILMISEELPELIGMADQLIVMKDFKVTKVFPRSRNLKQTDVIEYMI